MRGRAPTCVVLAAVLLLAAGTTLPALTVGDVLWGFNRRVVPDRMNIVSVLFINESEAAFDGEIELYKTNGLQRLGAVLTQECYISAGRSRWVQFVTHNWTDREEWVLRWGRALNQMQSLKSPKLGAPAARL